MKKILFLLPKTQQGGAETQMLYLIRGINKKKFNVSLGLLYQNEQMKKEFESMGNVKIINFNKKSKLDLFVYFRIARFIRKNKIDVICSFMGNHHSYLPALISSKVIAVGGIRNTSAKDITGLQRFNEITLNKIMMKLTNYTLISNSYSAKEAYVQKGFSTNAISVIPNGVNYALFSKGNGSKIVRDFKLKNKFVMSFVARLVKSKNHGELILKFKEILKHRKDAVLLIIGDGPERSKLESLSKGLDLSEKVIFTGNRTDVSDFLAATDLFVFPSRHPEGWPNVIGEAMAAGLPIVTYPAGDVSYMIKSGTNGVITEKNISAFINEIIILVKDKKKRCLISKNAQKRVKEKFAIEQMVQQYEKNFAKLCEGEK